MKNIAKCSLLIGSCLFSLQATGKCNWLIGASGGYQWQSIDYFSIVDYGPVNTNSYTTASNDFHASGGLLGIFAGYQVTNQDWTFGLELHFDKTFIDEDQTDRLAPVQIPFLFWDQQTSYTNDYSLGLSGRIGYTISDFITPYIRVGVEVSKYDLAFSGAFNPAILLPSAYPTGFDKSRWVTSFFGGAGIEVPLSNDNLALRLEYQYHPKSSSIKAEAFSNFFGGPVQFTNEVEPSKHTAKASIVLHI